MGCGCNNKNNKSRQTIIDPKKGFVESKKTSVSEVSLAATNRAKFEEKKKEPSILTKALTLGSAVANHVADGMSKCSKSELAIRLDICDKCPERDNTTCTKCGCLLTVKAGWKTATCPMDKWPTLIEK
jgi:hypothetical protein